MGAVGNRESQGFPRADAYSGTGTRAWTYGDGDRAAEDWLWQLLWLLKGDLGGLRCTGP